MREARDESTVKDRRQMVRDVMQGRKVRETRVW